VVEAHENMGFLPGAVEDKFAPYFAPFREVLEERLGRGHVTALIKGGRIEMAPLAYMRGRSFKQSFVVLDEAQNTNPAQMKLFLTRIGEGSVVVVNGDFAQQDIAGECGLSDAVQRFAKLEGIAHVQFGRADIVRSGLVQQIVEGYEPVLQSAQLCA
ncbi:MAG: PhoH family protein, partial [Pseudomonadales bacterium]